MTTTLRAIVAPAAKSYTLPDESPRRAGRVWVRALGYLAGAIFCAAFWLMFGYAAGCWVGWAGQ
jgi:hypothetical protein